MSLAVKILSFLFSANQNAQVIIAPVCFDTFYNCDGYTSLQINEVFNNDTGFVSNTMDLQISKTLKTRESVRRQLWIWVAYSYPRAMV